MTDQPAGSFTMGSGLPGEGGILRPMSTRQHFIQRWESEQPAFLKVLRAVPGGQLSYRPHERSASAGGLAWQIADQQRQMAQIVNEGKVVIDPRPAPASIDQI